MKIPINWLNEFVRLPKSEKELTDKLTMLGHMLDKKEVINGNVVIDLELRGNRADCYSIVGIAREVAAAFDTKVKYPKTLILKKRTPKNFKLEVDKNFVKRVMAVQIKDVQVEKSPKWLTEKLQEYGMESINYIVDLTNYVMIETGQPLHAFDLDLTGPNLSIRLAKPGERMTTFQGKSLTFDQNDLVWANKNAILSLAGAIGSREYSISPKTKNILLEAANYDRANIRRSIHRHKLLTEAGIRHEKELDPNLVEVGIGRFLELLNKKDYVCDYYPRPVKPWKVSLSLSYLETLSGTQIDQRTVIKILKSLNFQITKKTKDILEILVPTYRTDVTTDEDVIEEILRIYGYDKIPTQTLSLEIPKVVTPDYINQELKIKEIMTGLGFDEIISSSFVSEKYLGLNIPVDNSKKSPVKIINRPSPDNEYLRTTLFANLYEITNKILNERGSESYLFEIGKVYYHKDKYLEKRKLGIMYYQKDAEFVHFKGYLESLFEKLNIENPKFDEYKNGFLAKIGKEIVTYGFEHKNIYYTEIDLDSLLGKGRQKRATLWPKYPPQIEDITISFPKTTRIGEVVDLVKQEKLISEIELIDIYKDSYTFKVWYQSPEKTLTDSEVEKIRNKYLKQITEKFGGTFKN